MNKKEKEQVLNLLKQGISLCLPNYEITDPSGGIASLHLKIEKVITKPENIKLIRKWISED